MISGRPFLIGLAGVLAAPAIGQPGATPDPAIVVTGPASPDEEQALATVRRVAQPVDGQLARFHDPVCPAVIGFDTKYEALVVEWIKATAEAVGALVGGQGCSANLFVVIVDDGPGFVRALVERDAAALNGLPRAEFEQLAYEEGAARAWSTTRLTNSLGQSTGRPSRTQGGGAVKSGFAGSSVSFGDVDVLRVYDSSNVNPSVQQSVDSAWVVIETRSTLGKSLRQVADYAAMRGLAMVRPAMLQRGERTILGLFEPGGRDSPAALTEFDLAYLRSLYRVPARRWARSQMRYIADAIARDSAEQGR